MPTSLAFVTPTTVKDGLALEIAGGIVAKKYPTTARGMLTLSGMDSPFVRSFLAGLLASPEPEMRTMGLAGELERSVPSALTDLIRINESIAADPNYE